MSILNGWLNVNKPRGITSAKLVSSIKHILRGSVNKIGHTGTLDPEAYGILPMALGEATKLSRYLLDVNKEYIFTIQFGIKTTTADKEGEVLCTTDKIPNLSECLDIVNKFTGNITQTPPIYSAIKVNGVRAYDIARQGKSVELKSRSIHIYSLEFLSYDAFNKTATYKVLCSKGTYIRSLAEDIALSLQSLGFVLDLRRSRVGLFDDNNSIDFAHLSSLDIVCAKEALLQKVLRVDVVLADIPVLDICDKIAYKVRNGQVCVIDKMFDLDEMWLRHNGELLAIGSLNQGYFNSKRVFNLSNKGDQDVDYARTQSRVS